MKFTAKRLLAAGAICISAIVTPIALSVAIPGIGNAPSSLAGATTGTPTNPDEIIFGQSSTPPAGLPPSYFQYVKGDGSGTVTQTVNAASGKCGTPTAVVGPNGNGPILNIVGQHYTDNAYTTTPTPVTVGSSSLQVGVCTIPPAWAINNDTSKDGAEALDFSPGTDTNEIGTNRLFTDAQIPIQRKDSGASVTLHPQLTVNLLEFDSTTPTPGTQVGEQTCTISGGQGVGILADTDLTNSNPAGSCVNTTAQSAAPQQTGFEMVEVQDAVPNTSISVVGPTATFLLTSDVCFGNAPLEPSGTNAVNAPLSITATGACKSYTSYSYTETGGVQALNFDAFSTNPVPYTIDVTWNPVPECQPTPNPQPSPDGALVYSPPLGTCAVSEFTLNNTTYYDEVFCPAPQRTDAATVKGSSPTVLDASITAADQGRGVSGPGIPAGTYVGTVTVGTSFLLSSSATSQVPPAGVNATGPGSNVTLAGTAYPQRTDAATVTAGSATVNDPSVSLLDEGQRVSGTGIPANTYVGTVTAGQSFLLSSSPTSQVPLAGVNATANASSVNVGVPACVTNKTYSNITVNGVPETVVSEQWNLLADWGTRY